ncbi:hypothetical protein F5I97DRAFT_1901730 [Phlebopus sp. FC_14]|nr:hypothetical protein F5I97DRAFT_1901730 [Phlebopus sp. FC_14]
MVLDCLREHPSRVTVVSKRLQDRRATGGKFAVCTLASASRLLGEDARESALVDQWMHFAEHENASFSYEIMALLAGYLGPYSKELHDILVPRQARALKFLDAHLALSMTKFLIADTLSLTNIALAAVTQ